MSLWVMADDEAVVSLDGDLDTYSSEYAFSYVGDIIDNCRRRVIVDLSGLDYCDAQGLRTLVRICDHAEKSGCAVQLTAPRESLAKIVRVTELDLKFYEL